MKRLFSKIRLFFSKINWFLRRKYNQAKSFIVSYLKLAYQKISQKEKRLAKRRIKRDFVKDYLKLRYSI